jgi:hypothetical protein
VDGKTMKPSISLYREGMTAFYRSLCSSKQGKMMFLYDKEDCIKVSQGLAGACIDIYGIDYYFDWRE